jgi:DNA/RNA-binding domain of Phe-tRNA-synthetase-like protein
MQEELELRAAPGFVAPDLRDEFPGLRLDWVSVDAGMRSSPREVKRRLKELSSRYRGASVVAMRTQPIPHAYRAFFHQIGLDPDTSRIPSEEVAIRRLLQGHFASKNLIEDALLIALIETGVPVWALDADHVEAGGLGIRPTVAGDRLGSTPLGHHLPPGRLAVTDSRGVHALLFGELAPGHGVSSRTGRIVLFAIGVEGVPLIHVEEALWICVEVIKAGRD